MSKQAIKAAGSATTLSTAPSPVRLYSLTEAGKLYRVPREGRRLEPQLVELIAVCGPGDEGEPVLTVMEPGED